MAKKSVSGKTKEELDELRKEFENSPASEEKTFEEAYCLAKIPRQPDDYDGPERYCVLRRVKENGRCKFHGGEGYGNPENLDPLANMKHGMYATEENLMKDFDEKDRALYNWVLTAYPEAYDIDLTEDPSSHHDLRILAIEMVRSERGYGHIIKEGEKMEKPVRNAEGELVVDSDGEVVTEDSEHYLAGMMNRQNNLLIKIKKSLGITRKQRLEREETEEGTEVIETIAEIGSEVIDSDAKEYDPTRYEPDN
jgi:hypothetical protein